jgi:hypothetical protein
MRFYHHVAPAQPTFGQRSVRSFELHLLLAIISLIYIWFTSGS